MSADWRTAALGAANDDVHFDSPEADDGKDGAPNDAAPANFRRR
jgi:hypothetical protein